jgi:hypothetical protein
MEMKVKKVQPSFTFWATCCYNPIVKSGDFSPQSKKKQEFWQPEKKQNKNK